MKLVSSRSPNAHPISTPQIPSSGPRFRWSWWWCGWIVLSVVDICWNMLEFCQPWQLNHEAHLRPLTSGWTLKCGRVTRVRGRKPHWRGSTNSAKRNWRRKLQPSPAPMRLSTIRRSGSTARSWPWQWTGSSACQTRRFGCSLKSNIILRMGRRGFK